MEKDVTNLNEVIEQQDAHHRLLCALEGRPYETPAERKRLSVLAEAWRRGELIADVLAEGGDPLPEGIEARLAAALRGETYVALPAGIHQPLAEALESGGPALPEGIEGRLARAL
jgi:hypothetical protein